MHIDIGWKKTPQGFRGAIRCVAAEFQQEEIFYSPKVYPTKEEASAEAKRMVELTQEQCPEQFKNAKWITMEDV